MRLFGPLDSGSGWSPQRRSGVAYLEHARARLAAAMGTGPEEHGDAGAAEAIPAAPAVDDAAVAVAGVAAGLAAGCSPIDGAIGPDGMTIDDVSGLAVALGSGVERAAAARVLVAAEAHRRGLPGLDGRAGLKGWLRRTMALSSAEAATLARQARFVGRHPEVAHAVATARCSTSHLWAIVTYVPADREDLFDECWPWIAEAAAQLDADRFTTLMRTWRLHADQDRPPADPAQRNRVRTWVGPDGTGHVDAELDPEAWEIVLAALERHDRPDPTDGLLPPRSRQQRLADQLLAMAKHWLGLLPTPDVSTRAPVPDGRMHETAEATAEPAPRPPQPGPGRTSTINVLVDVELLQPDVLDRLGLAQRMALRCELERFGPISTSTAQRLLCDSYVSRLVLQGRSTVLDMGFRTATFTEAQRRALLVEFATCPCGCGTPAAQCDIHHIEPHDPASERGPTDQANGVPLCRRSHVLVHDGRLRLRKLAPGIVLFLRT